jgi:hypothetical protein
VPNYTFIHRNGFRNYKHFLLMEKNSQDERIEKELQKISFTYIEKQKRKQNFKN